MRKYAKAFGILIMFLFLMALVVPVINGNISSDDFGPVTSIIFDEHTGMVTLVAFDYPLDGGGGVNATYYKIDGGAQTKYTEPFQLPEGTHTVEYWSLDNAGNEEAHKASTFTYDSTPPTVEIKTPISGKLYLFGKPIMDRILSDTTLCIGNITIEANANDGDGYGVKAIFFEFSNGDSGYDNNATDGWAYNFNNAHFGELEVSVTAIDEKELMSEPYTMTINVYSLGILWYDGRLIWKR